MEVPGHSLRITEQPAGLKEEAPHCPNALQQTATAPGPAGTVALGSLPALAAATPIPRRREHFNNKGL